MKGFGMISINNVGWIEKEAPKPGPFDAILKPIAVAPCSSDTHVSHGGAGPMENRILGHESVGEVVEVGSAVRNFKVGDRVVVNCCTPDWEAPLLQDGFDNNAHDYGFTASFKFACVDGPDFTAYEIDFDEAMSRGRMYFGYERHAHEEVCNLFKNA